MNRRTKRDENGMYMRDENEMIRHERLCNPCGQWLDENAVNFSYNNGKGRYNSWCRPCVRAHQHTQRQGGQGRRFGLEIEFVGDPIRLEQEMRARGLECERQGYNHRTMKIWKIVPDATVRNGAELVSPPLRGEEGRRQVELASEALIAAGCKVDKRCGLHVHHEVTRLKVEDLRRFVTGWFNSRDAIDKLVAPSRRAGQNHYCRELSSYDVEFATRLSSMRRPDARISLRHFDRYRSLNLASYPKYGTVEVRQHQGTIEAKKILAWVAFGQAFIAAAIAGRTLDEQNTPTLLDELRLHGSLSEETTTYLKRRAKLMAPRKVTA